MMQALKMEIEQKSRLCKVGEELGYFHIWEQYSKPFPASPMIGGEPAGVFSKIFGIVEFQDGVKRVDPTDICFCDEENEILRVMKEHPELAKKYERRKTKMIKFENTEVMGLEHAIRGMRNSMNSWNKSDSGICKGGDNGIGCENCSDCGCDHEYDRSFKLGKEDHKLMMKLAKGGSVHGKFRRMITVYVDITAPLYWWKEFDTYKVGTVANSCSTMHKIHEKEFTIDDFSHEHLLDADELGWGDFVPARVLDTLIMCLNQYRKLYLETKDKKYWWQMIQLLPSSYNQLRTVMLNYEVLANIYISRKDHKLDEWREFCKWIETLQYSEIITCGVTVTN